MDTGLILGGLAAAHSVSKAAPVFVEKIADAIAGIAAPYQLKRMAKSQAAATILEKEAEATGNIAALEVYERAGYRSAAEEVKRQLNIEAITKAAIPLLLDDSKPENMDGDWIAHFFDKSRLTSDAEMQSLWARILAGEANSPGAFSKRTINLVSEISKREAEDFTKLCGFAINNLVLIFDFEEEIYKKAGIDVSKIRELEHAGLVTQAPVLEYQCVGLPQRQLFRYFDVFIHLTLPQEKENSLTVGKVALTPAGLELAYICGAQKVPEFVEHLTQRWKDYGAAVIENPIVRDPTDLGIPTQREVAEF